LKEIDTRCQRQSMTPYDTEVERHLAVKECTVKAGIRWFLSQPIFLAFSMPGEKPSLIHP
jgi:hypothetical protein